MGALVAGVGSLPAAVGLVGIACAGMALILSFVAAGRTAADPVGAANG